jgi:hypothetical protein
MASRRPKTPLALAARRPAPMAPTALEEPQSVPELVEVPHDPSQEPLINGSNSYLRTYRQGGCTVIVTREFGRWHMSIAHKHRYPTWLEISAAWYRCIPDAAMITGGLMLPRLTEYVNIHNFCMHVIQIEEPDEPCPNSTSTATATRVGPTSATTPASSP